MVKIQWGPIQKLYAFAIIVFWLYWVNPQPKIPDLQGTPSSEHLIFTSIGWIFNLKLPKHQLILFLEQARYLKFNQLTRIWIHNHFVRRQTLNHLDKLAKWLSGDALNTDKYSQLSSITLPVWMFCYELNDSGFTAAN